MVQFRGININIVSQFDARRLPEHSTARAFDASGTVVACYVPVHAGAQIWLEYSVDGPHPPQAAYFFKMLMNGQVVTSWDCTAKHEYQGKAVYLLQTVRSTVNNQLSVLQKSMAFGSIDRSKSPDARNDCIEIRVHRIEHRRRTRELPLDIPSPKQLRGQDTLRLRSHGLIEPYRPARKYQYQLLDPHDEPYTTFRFYCRTQEYLERHQIIDVDVDRSLSSTSLATSSPPSTYFNASSSPVKEVQSQTQTDVVVEEMEVATESEAQGQGQPSTPTKHVVHELSADYYPPSVTLKQHNFSPRLSSPIKLNSPRSPGNPHSPRSPFRSSRRDLTSISPLKLKDSIEDLPSTVPRSPQLPRRVTFPPPTSKQEDVPPSPTQRSSPLLPEALRIRKSRSLTSDIQRLFLNASTPPREKSTLGSPVTQTLPAPRFIHPSSNSTPPGTVSPRPARLPYQRHKPTHLNLDLSLGGCFIPSPNSNTAKNSLHDPARTMICNNISSTTTNLPQKPPPVFDTTSNITLTSTKIPHRPLSPFTQSGLLRRLSYTSSNVSLRNRKTSMPRLSTPSPSIPTVQDIDAAVQAVPSEKTGDQIVNERKDETDGISPSRTLRRMRSTGLLNGLFGKGGRRVIT